MGALNVNVKGPHTPLLSAGPTPQETNSYFSTGCTWREKEGCLLRKSGFHDSMAEGFAKGHITYVRTHTALPVLMGCPDCLCAKHWGGGGGPAVDSRHTRFSPCWVSRDVLHRGNTSSLSHNIFIYFQHSFSHRLEFPVTVFS